MDKIIEGLRDNAWNGLIGVITITGIIVTGFRYMSSKDNRNSLFQNFIKVIAGFIKFLSTVKSIFTKILVNIFGWLFAFPQYFWLVVFIGYFIAIKADDGLKAEIPTRIPISYLLGFFVALVLLLMGWFSSMLDSNKEKENILKRIKDLETEILAIKNSQPDSQEESKKIEVSSPEQKISFFSDPRTSLFILMMVTFVILFFLSALRLLEIK